MQSSFAQKILIFLSLLSAEPVFSQPVPFVKYYGDASKITTGKTAIQVPGGSIFLAGTETESATGSSRIIFSKILDDGTLTWSQRYGFSASDNICEEMIYDGNGSFIISANRTDSVTGVIHGMLLKVDTNGVQDWMYSYGSAGINSLFAGLAPCPGGGWLVTGQKPNPVSGITNILVFRCDSNGIEKWSNVYGDPGNIETGMGIVQAPDADMVISGDVQVSATEINPYIFKIDTSGALKWDLLLSMRNNGGCKSIRLDRDNHLLLVGEASTDSSLQFDVILAKADLSGNLFWIKYIPASNESDAGFSVVESDQHEYLISGYGFDTSTQTKRVVIYTTDTSGIELEKKYFGIAPVNIGYSIQALNAPYFLAAGTDFTNDQAILIFDKVSGNIGIEEFSERNSILAWPNPLCSGSVLHFNHSVGSVSCLDVSGKLIFQNKLTNGNSFPENCSLNKLSPGFYQLLLTSDGVKQQLKLIVTK